MRFENDLLSFELPNGWETEEDDSRNIICMNPDDPEVWLQVELGGVEKPGGEIEASSFLKDCYATEISAGEAVLAELNPRSAIIRRRITTTHNGKSYVVSYCHLGHNPAQDNLQMAQFGLAYPAERGSSQALLDLVEFADHSASGAAFKSWQRAK